LELAGAQATESGPRNALAFAAGTFSASWKRAGRSEGALAQLASATQYRETFPAPQSITAEGEREGSSERFIEKCWSVAEGMFLGTASPLIPPARPKPFRTLDTELPLRRGEGPAFSPLRGERGAQDVFDGSISAVREGIALKFRVRLPVRALFNH
jgi:hypothetical protein